jgi:hypothetical protein
MSNEKQVDSGRRGLLVATCAAGGVAGLAATGAFVATFAPSERAKAAGAPVEVDIADLVPGEMKTVEWRGKPVWVLKRSPEMLDSLKKIEGQLADPKSERNPGDLTPDMRAMNIALSSRKFWSRLASARTWAVPRSPNSRREPSLPFLRTGPAVFCARVTAPLSILPAAYIKTSLLPTTWKCRVTCLSATPSWLSAKMRKARRNHGIR